MERLLEENGALKKQSFNLHLKLSELEVKVAMLIKLKEQTLEVIKTKEICSLR